MGKNKKWFKRFIGKLNRCEGISLTPIIVMIVLLSIMAGAFGSIMGNWKLSAPVIMNSSKAFYLAEAAAMFALQDAKKSIDEAIPVVCGQRLNLVTVIADNGNGESADYWIEMPLLTDDPLSGGLGAMNSDDDNINDDLDDNAAGDELYLYTIIATGRVNIGGATVGKRQIKVFFDLPAIVETTLANTH